MDFVMYEFKLLSFWARRRSCPGKAYAVAVVEKMLANLLCKFDLTLPNGVKLKDLDMGETFESKWSRPYQRGIGLYNSWYQSKSGRHLRSRQQLHAIQREIRRENEAHLGTCMRKISRDCKEILKKKLEEIRGHILKFCPTNNKSNGKNADKDSSENTKESEEYVKPANPTVVLKYSESIHVSTTYMIKGTDHGTWDDI
ncbi:ARID DNA-binding domain-containing protein, partial [Tanacetum coccineum]